MMRDSCRRVIQVAATAAFIALGFAATGAAQGSKVYWADPTTSTIERSDLDGSLREPILSGLGSVVGIALDVAGGKMYWTDIGAGTIRRANLDGSGGVDDLVTGLTSPLGIALDVSAGKMYWINETPRLVQRADLDGANVETVVSGLGDPHNIALDLDAGKMYITDATGCSCVRRANLDGSGLEVVVSGIANPYAIALDLDGGKVYWTDAQAGAGKIQRADLDGSSLETILTGLLVPTGLALDVPAGNMYWTEYSAPLIRRAMLDGTGVETIVSTGLGNPHGIALDLKAPSTPPVITKVSASPASLWPPNHKMVSVLVTVDASPGSTCGISTVDSNEAVIGLGDGGNTTPDWLVTGLLSVDLRSERSGARAGRAYTITVTCVNADLQSTSSAVVVTVPHDQKK